MTYLIKLGCGHKWQTEIKLSFQYSKDVHLVYCLDCNYYGCSQPLHWHEVVSVKEVKDGSLHNVPIRQPSIMPKHIMRLQEGVPPNRRRLFPYARGVRGR